MLLRSAGWSFLLSMGLLSPLLRAWFSLAPYIILITLADSRLVLFSRLLMEWTHNIVMKYNLDSRPQLHNSIIAWYLCGYSLRDTLSRSYFSYTRSLSSALVFPWDVEDWFLNFDARLDHSVGQFVILFYFEILTSPLSSMYIIHSYYWKAVL